MAATAVHTMAKRNDVSVKMAAEVVEDCRIAAAFKGMTLAEYLSESMRPVANRDIEEGHARRARKEKQPERKGGSK